MANTTELKRGMLLKHGEYRIERVLGQGGFGITYEAEQVSLGRKVAVKEFYMKEHCNRDGGSHVSVPSTGSRELVEKFRDKFVKEARMLAGFDHQSIVRVIDVFEENGTAYYVMKHLDGGSLQSLVNDRGRLSETEALRYIREIAGALDYIHRRGTLHLDVKPGNIMLDGEGRAVLIDFGISKHVDVEGHLTSSTPLAASRGYAPLEQVAQEASSTYSAATDIYSLGATLYFLLTGKRPLEASALLKGLPTAELEAAGVSESTVNAIKSAMQVSKEDRPQSIDDFKALLKRKTRNRKTAEKKPENPVTDESTRLGTRKPKVQAVSKEPDNDSIGQYRIEEGLTNEAKGKLSIMAACVAAALLLVGLFIWHPWRTQPSVRQQPQQTTTASNASSSGNMINGHEYVDLGLSVKWATCNVGASSPEGYGDYFAWGETSPKSSYDWENLKYRTKGDSYDNVKFSKYVASSEYGSVDNRTRLELSDDAARVNWGGSWRMPTRAEQDELREQCRWQWTTVNGHNGYRVTSKRNGRSIFLPAAGYRYGGSSNNVGSRGYYWSSSLGTSGSRTADYLVFDSSNVDWGSYNRNYGLSVRAVSE